MNYRTINLEGYWVIQKKRTLNFIQKLLNMSEWKIVRYRTYEHYVNMCYKFQKYIAIFDDHETAIKTQNILEELETHEILKYDKYDFHPIIYKSSVWSSQKYHIVYISDDFYHHSSEHDYKYRFFSKEECKQKVDEILSKKNKQKQLNKLMRK